MSTRAPYLHVANGSSTTRTMADAGIPGLRSIWADPLHDGPVPHGISDEQLIDVRTRYLGAAYPHPADPVNDLRAWRTIIERDEAYDELVLWYEHDLFDQLNLIQLLSWLREARPTPRPVSLICIDSFPGRPNFKGLGELTASELAPLLDTRRPVTDDQYALAARAWDAFRQPSPMPLERLLHGDLSALPFLRAALVRWLQEFPWTRDGLSLNERRLLQLAAARELSLSMAFHSMSEGERAYYTSDLSLQSLAERLSRTSPPLLQIGGRALSDAPSETTQGASGWFTRTIVTTEAGRRMLAGEHDRVTLCGIDCWLGGVLLRGHEVAWRWDDERSEIVSSSH